MKSVLMVMCSGYRVLLRIVTDDAPVIDTQYATNSLRVAATNCCLVLVLLHFLQTFQRFRR